MGVYSDASVESIALAKALYETQSRRDWDLADVPTKNDRINWAYKLIAHLEAQEVFIHRIDKSLVKVVAEEPDWEAVNEMTREQLVNYAKAYGVDLKMGGRNFDYMKRKFKRDFYGIGNRLVGTAAEAANG